MQNTRLIILVSGGVVSEILSDTRLPDGLKIFVADYDNPSYEKQNPTVDAKRVQESIDEFFFGACN